MNVTHVTGSVSTHGGGIALALCALAKSQENEGITVSVMAPDDGGRPVPGWPEGQPIVLPSRRLGPLLWGENMQGRLKREVPEVVHTHGLWGQPSIVASRMGSGPAKVVSPHGMLDPWALQHGRLRKWVAMRLFERPLLNSAACLHALCRSEADSIRALGFRRPIAIIPNGVDLPEAIEKPASRRENSALLFLGRLHPKKGLPDALRAFAQFRDCGEGPENPKSWQFVIAGWDQGGHEKELKELCRSLGLPFSETPAQEWLEDRNASASSEVSADQQSPPVQFVGPAFGEVKEQLLSEADAFILPSLSEGLPVAVLEAWAYGLPVLMTDHCNLPEGFEARAARRISPDCKSIADGMSGLLCSAPPERQAIGQNGRLLVARQFTWPQVAAQMKSLYRWILGSGGKPDFVELV